MKVCVIQPLYPTDYERSDEMYQWQLDAMDKCDATMDLIVLPESTDVPCFAKKREQAMASHNKYIDGLIKKASETAKRCDSVLFLNAYRETPTGLRNTTYAFDRNGDEAGYYYKQHLTPGETSERKLDSDYSFEHTDVPIVVIDGLRYAFLTCYDFYFYEAFAKIARTKPDIIIGCSHQRSDTHNALEMMSKCCAYNCNAYVVRSSVSMGDKGDIGGCSMVVTPKGEVLLDLKNEVGMATVEIDPNEKYYKPGGFNNPLMAHYEYIEKGRRPWKYRPGGSAIARHDALMPYPRVCAHRGFNTIAPENSMAAFGAAIALGAKEIEFDLWYTADGEVVSCHDRKLDRVSDGEGYIDELTYPELLKFDFGVKFSEKFKGLKILRFEEILKKFSCHTIMNIHIKTVDNKSPANEDFLMKIIELIRRYDCEKYVYFMSGNDFVLQQLTDLAPDLPRCCGGGDDKWGIVERAIKYKCQKLQFFKEYVNKEMVDKAHENGIICNAFYADTPEKAKEYLDMGIDVILTNDYLTIKGVVENA